MSILEKAGTFFNGSAPVGWVEVQRFDDVDERLESDEIAAVAIVEAANMPGTAMAMFMDSGIMVRLDATGELDLVPGATIPAGRTIAVVPVEAARRLGFEVEGGNDE